MHLVESYALSCGAKIGTPKLYTGYYPLPSDKYITLQAQASCQSKQYDYWDIVVSILYPILTKHGIKIVQIGGKNDINLFGCVNLSGKTKLKQTFYLIDNAMAHVGCDSFAVHAASSFDKPIVSLYSNSIPKMCGPFFNKKSRTICIEPERNSLPSHSYTEVPKSINKIKPEDIARSVCEILGLEFDFGYRTIFTGAGYINKNIEIVPTVAVNINNSNIKKITVRMDYHFNESVLDILLKTYNAVIVTDRPINLNLLLKNKSKINEVYYKIKEDDDPNFIKSLKRLNIKYSMVSDLDEAATNDKKIKYMDYGIIIPFSKKKLKDIKEIEGKDINNLYYRSSKVLINGNQSYKSKFDMDNNIATPFNDQCFYTVSKLMANNQASSELDFISILEKVD